MLEKHVVSLGLAQELVKSGFVLESQFYWWRGILTINGKTQKFEWKLGQPTHDLPREYWQMSQAWEKKHYKIERYPAPIATELGDILPAVIDTVDKHPRIGRWGGLTIDKHSNGWLVSYNGSIDNGVKNRDQGTLQESLGWMLIFLRQEKLI